VISSNLGARRFVAPVIAALLWLMVPATAAAHADLETSTPADAATVPSPFAGPIVLTFSEPLADGSRADLVDADGTPIAAATVDSQGATMTITLVADLGPGEYEVRWVSVAGDGDLQRDTFLFTVVPAPATASPSQSQSVATPPASASGATPQASASGATQSSAPASDAPPASPVASPGGDDATSSPGDVLIPIVVALLVVGVGAAYLFSRRNRPMSPR
jgi:methionine-rich copper-binding protein CopC